MALDFSKLTGSNPADTVLHPRDLFAALPNKDPRFAYPRDVQSEVWSQWFDRRDERDLVIKMNTGSGKTVVGLLLLKSCLNETKGPAAYIAPDKYLARQVILEAQALGLPTTDEPRDPHFTSGKAILVTNVFKLINGRSVFGTRDTGIQIPIGSLVIDDAHSCLNTTDSQFTLTLPANSEPYKKLFALFEEDLRQQSATGVLEIKSGDPLKRMVLPFWAWRRRYKEAVAILHKARDSEELRFSWPLLKDALGQADAVFGGGRLEISTRCIPIDVIPSCDAAKRRIFLTATLADDTVLITTFAVTQQAATQPITPDAAGDLGERLILAPFALNPHLTESDFKDLILGLSKGVNVTVIVPSGARAQAWAAAGGNILSGNTLEEGVSRLRTTQAGLTVIVNRYDGIDLPGNACRVLVLDGLPTARRLLDQVDDSALYGTDELLAQTVQRIEQGMGRAIRSADDWCIVLLTGRSLTDHLFNQRALGKLTAGTLAQLRLSEQVGDQLRGKPPTELRDALVSVISRDPSWVRASKAALVGVRYSRAGQVNPLAIAQRAAFDAERAGNVTTARALLQDAANRISDPRTRGWFKQQLARVVDLVDESGAQEILLSASMDNHLITRPIVGITYQRLAPAAQQQAQALLESLTAAALNSNSWLVRIESLLETLQFTEDSAPQFEAGLRDLLLLLGLTAQRPDRELGSGPDVLASLGNRTYWVIECKNGATATRISKADSNQLAGSVNWFADHYDKADTALPLIIHPSATFEANANPPKGTRVMDRSALDAFHHAVRQFARALAAQSWPVPVPTIANLLEAHALAGGALPFKFSTAIKKGK